MRSANQVGLTAILLLFIVLNPGTWAAQPAVESFSGGANGWVGTSDFGTGNWSFTGGAARVAFFDPGFGFPDLCTLSNSPGATSGSFTGNYENAGIEVIGFSFMALNGLPASSVVELEWGGSTSVYRRGFSVTTTGVWFNFTASVQDDAQGQWTVIKGSLANFAAARQSVRHVALRMSRTLTVAHQFVIDDLFIAGKPGGNSVSRDVVGRIEWGGLLAGVGYQVQSTTNLLLAPWETVENLTATGVLHATIITNESRSMEAYRIRFE